MKHTPGPWSIRADLAITAYDAETEEHQPIARAFGDGSLLARIGSMGDAIAQIDDLPENVIFQRA